MSVHKTKSGTFRVRWRVNGRLKSKNFRRKIDADKFDAKLTLGEKVAAAIEKPASSGISFQEFALVWLRDYGQVHKTEPSLIRDRQIIRDYLSPKWGKSRWIRSHEEILLNYKVG